MVDAKEPSAASRAKARGYLREAFSSPFLQRDIDSLATLLDTLVAQARAEAETVVAAARDVARLLLSNPRMDRLRDALAHYDATRATTGEET